MATIEKFRTWLEELTRFSENAKSIEVVDDRQGPFYEHERQNSTEPLVSSRVLAIKIYTDTNCYSIRGIERPKKNGYLGCIALTRKPRAGEDHHRGNDLADGPLDYSTWKKILADIVGYELVRVHKMKGRSPADATVENSGDQPELQEENV